MIKTMRQPTKAGNTGAETAAARLERQRSRVDFQVSVLTAIVVSISCYLIFFLNYHLSYKSMIGELQERAVNIYSYLDQRLDNRIFLDLNSRGDEQTALYQDSRTVLEGVKNTAGVRHLYTAKKTEDGKFIYLVDGISTEDSGFRHVNDLIENECIPDLMRALSGRIIFPGKINKTERGKVFISYFPVREGDAVIGVMGIEFDAARQYNCYKLMSILTPLVIIAFCLISAAAALRWFRRISNPSYQDIASTDFLTGLKNRNAFEVDLHNLDHSAEQLHLTLVSIDLDDLKHVNDTYGHAYGDDYLCLCCRILMECANPGDRIYRIGGDEFSVIMKNRDEAWMERYVGEIHKKAESESGKYAFCPGLSIGYAFYEPERDKTLFDTLKRADARMYQCKKDRKRNENR